MGDASAPIRILIADDHWIVREGLRRYLSTDASFTVVGEADDGASALRLAADLRPDVVLMDLLMPGLDGVDATAQLHSQLPRIAILALTSSHDRDMVVAAVRAGAIGYLLKDSGGEELKRAIRAAAAGRAYLSDNAATQLLDEIQTQPANPGLTERELDVLRLLARGLGNKEIARALAIGDGTVKTHVRSVFAKLNVRGRTQAALVALELGLVSHDRRPID